MFMHRHYQVRSFSTENWVRKGPPCSKSKSVLWRPYWIRSEILNDVHQGPIIVHNCAQYQLNPFIHVWDLVAEWLPYVKYGEYVICCLPAILDQKFKMRIRASMGHNRQCSCLGNTRSGHSVLRTESGKDTPAQSQNRPYDGHIGSDRKFYMTCTKVLS